MDKLREIYEKITELVGVKNAKDTLYFAHFDEKENTIYFQPMLKFNFNKKLDNKLFIELSKNTWKLNPEYVKLLKFHLKNYKIEAYE